MKRGEPLQRKTRLTAKKPMPRGAGLKQGAPKKAKPKKGGGSNAGLPELKKQARRRDENTCVMCGRILSAGEGNVHHRRNRGQGGSRKANVITNLITLCGTPSTECHGEVTLTPWKCDAAKNGWVLSTNGKADPATEPVNVAWLGWAYPLADGTWQVIDDITAVRS